VHFSLAEQEEDLHSSLSIQSISPQSFTFTIDQPTDGDFIVPTNGRATAYQIPSRTYGVPYAWEIYIDNVFKGTFTGNSSGSATA
jgi:hypothetical protein